LGGKLSSAGGFTLLPHASVFKSTSHHEQTFRKDFLSKALQSWEAVLFIKKLVVRFQASIKSLLTGKALP
jgi:hypothetical protein